MNNCLKSQAAKELLIRRKARTDILHYVNAIDVPGKPVSDDDDNAVFLPIETSIADHHRLILSKLYKVSQTPHGRMMIFCPPGSAKSTYASVVFPSMFLGQTPNRRLILGTYGDSLAVKMGRRTRSIIKQPRYKGIFNCELTKESSAVQSFALTNGSEYMAGGLLSGMTGNRAHGIIIDDPVKGREQANSLVIRDKTWDAYEEDLKTRLIPGGFIVIIQTRWHIDDLSGRILPDNWNGESGSVLCKDGNYWEVICLQACCEVDNDPLGRKKGQYLWPEWFDTKHWEQFKSNPRMWQSLFQQLPTLTEGNFFKPDLIPIIQAEPSGLIKVRAWDFAATANDGDYTVGLLFGYNQQTKQGYILDIVRGQYAPEDVEKVLKNTADKDGRGVKILLPQDPGQAGKAQAKNFVRLLSGYSVFTATVSGDKETRASAIAAQSNVGNISILRAGWNREFIEELRNFPNGKNDDQVDALSDAYNHFITKKSGSLLRN